MQRPDTMRLFPARTFFGGGGTRPMIEMAIVGLGSWGLCVMERTVDRARRTGTPVRLHMVDPAQLGGGVYSAEQPDFLVLNNACGQLSLYAAPDSDSSPPYAVGLHQWAMVSGYRWVGYQCRIGVGGDPIRSTDYLPRRLMGEYLVWFYNTLVACAPTNLEIVRHYAAAVDISPALAGREEVLLDNGTTLAVDHVVLTSGHTWNDEPVAEGGVRYLRPYPVEYFDQRVPAGSSAGRGGHGFGRLRHNHCPHRRARWDVRGPLRPVRPLALPAVRPGADPRPLLAHGRALLRQVSPRRRPLRSVRAGGVHRRGVRGADQSGRVAGAAARGLPSRAAAPAVRRDAGALLLTGRPAGRGRRRVDQGPRRPASGLGRRALRQGRRRSRAALRALRPGRPLLRRGRRSILVDHRLPGPGLRDDRG